MDRDKWLAERRRGIGGSDASAALGVSRRKSALALYLEKIGEPTPDVDTPWMEWGRLLEPVIRAKYEQQHGCTVALPGLLRHERYPFLIGTPDGIADGRIVEFKTSRSPDGFGEAGTDQVPEDYILQTNHYLILTGLEVAHLAVLIAGSDYREYVITADRELQGMILEGEADFWDRVERRDPPAPNFESLDFQAVMRRLYPGTNGARVTATGGLEQWKRIHDEAREKAARYEAVAEGAKAHLLYEMGEASMLAFSDGRALRRKLTKRKGYVVEPSEFMDVRFINDKE